MPPLRIARLLALGSGLLDFSTGLGLVFAPALILPLMGVATPDGDALVYLRFVGAFVGSVGVSYLAALVIGQFSFLRSVLGITLIFRLAAGSYTAAALLLGWLPPAWISVPCTDLLLVAVQLWLLRKLPATETLSPSTP